MLGIVQSVESATMDRLLGKRQRIMGNPDYAFPLELKTDIDEYERNVRAFLSAGMEPEIFKAKRVPYGVYEQRNDGTYMVRVRVTAGRLTCEQVRVLSDLCMAFGDGRLHITTRQDIQFHSVSIGETPIIMRRLLEVGLTTKGGGGNTVRNITACPYAGICPNENLDVNPQAHQLTDYLIRQAGSYTLPRKYKISFSGCGADCGLAQIADLGFIGAIRHGRPGFHVFAGGGLGVSSRIGAPLLHWVPTTDVIRIAESVRRVFDRHGDRSNRSRARLRFVVERLGESPFRDAFRGEFDKIIRNGVPESVSSNLRREREAIQPQTPILEKGCGIRYLKQVQDGYITIPLHIKLGLVSAEEFARLGDLAARFSESRDIYATRAQGLQLRFVKEENLPLLAGELLQMKADYIDRGSLTQRIVSCTGADTCRLGLCLSRNASLACEERLKESGIIEKELKGLSIFINGCPNGCGHQPIAPVGFSGCAQRVDGRLVPAYKVTLGGRCEFQRARLGIAIGQIPAKAIPAFLCALAADFGEKGGAGEAFSNYFDRMGKAHFVNILNRHATVPRFEDAPDYYFDFGADELFSLVRRDSK